MSYAQSVSIGPRFFKKAFNDYSDKHWAFVREVMQNSIDCGSTHITVDIAPDVDDGTVVVVRNNGDPMDRDTLVDRLLSLGESGKDFKSGSVGGFGKAKEILYFAHRAYRVESGHWTVEGSGAGYNLTRTADMLDGTASTVVWEGNHVEALAHHFERFIALCGTGRRVEFFVNGVRQKPRHHPGAVARTLDYADRPWAEVRLSKVERGLLVVRIGGVPMFHRRIDYGGTVTLELLGTSADRLTSNRDGLKYQYQAELDDFVRAVTVDRRSAFLLERAEYKVIEGPKLKLRGDARPVPEAVGVAVAAHADVPEPMGGAGILVDVAAQAQAPRPSILGHEFVLKNCVRRPVPPQYDPDSLEFSDYAHWLIRAWAGSLLELYALHNVEDPFSVGFVFSTQAEAESERSYERGQVYYLNPCHVSKKGYTRRYRKAGRFRIVAGAAHEFVHGALGESYHGEDYANKLTEVMAAVMRNSRRFTRHLG